MTYGRWWQILLGTIITALGVLFLLDNLGFLSASRALAISWPLVLVLLGLLIMWGSGRWRGVSGGLEKAVGNVRIGPEEWDLRDMDTRIGVEAGAADVTITIPQGVAVRISEDTGLASFNVDTSRFPKVGKLYESPGFATAANRLELRVRGSLAKVAVR